MELKRCAGELVRHAVFSYDNRAVTVGGDDALSDGLVIFGTAVEGFEGGVGGRGILGLFEGRWVFGDWDWRGNGRGGGGGVLVV